MTAQQALVRVPLAEMQSTAARLAKELGGKTIQCKGLTIDGNLSMAIVAKNSTSAAWADRLATVIGER